MYWDEYVTGRSCLKDTVKLIFTWVFAFACTYVSRLSDRLLLFPARLVIYTTSKLLRVLSLHILFYRRAHNILVLQSCSAKTLVDVKPTLSGFHSYKGVKMFVIISLNFKCRACRVPMPNKQDLYLSILPLCPCAIPFRPGKVQPLLARVPGVSWPLLRYQAKLRNHR